MRILLVAAALAAQAPSAEKSRGLEALAKIPRVALEELRKDPDRWLGVRVSLTVALGEEKEVGNPYFTRFNAAQYARFSAWGNSQPLWEPKALESEFSQLFVRKDSPLLAGLRAAKRHQRFELTAIVRDSFRSLPWIEAIEAKTSGEWTPEGTLVAVARARRLLAEGQRHLALEEFQKALVDPLPKPEKEALEREIAALKDEIGE